MVLVKPNDQGKKMAFSCLGKGQNANVRSCVKAAQPLVRSSTNVSVNV